MKKNFANGVTEKSDEELYLMLSGPKKDARKAFDELYRRYSTKIYTYCRKIMNNDEVARDLFQETFTKFFESAQTSRNMSNVSGYLIKIARNLCLNEKKRKANDNVSFEEGIYRTQEKPYESREINSILETAIEALPESYREALVLKEYMDMTYKEIAELLNTNLSVIRIRIYRAKNKLREIMAPYINDLQD